MSLWTSATVAAATGGKASGDFAISGVAYDSREVGPGDLFVALKGEATDGHRFVAQAFGQGAAGVLVSEPADGPYILVADTTVALNALGAASRARTEAKIIGVTGSVGKTGTKEALFAALDRAVPGRAHRSVKSYNNHVGVPLSLARMPAGMRFGVFEMGMNHAGELDALTRLVRPHVALVTAIAPAHSAFFSGEEAIADAKGEIFRGLELGGTAIVPFDSPHRDRLIAAAEPYAAHIVTFGRGVGADVRATEAVRSAAGTLVNVTLPKGNLTCTIGLPGEHWVSNALAVLAAVEAVGGDLAAAGLALGEMAGLPGRGARRTVPLEGGEALLIDESYNANPASMAATIRELGQEKATRRIALLGEMRELGDGSAGYHAALAQPLIEAQAQAVILVGEGMAPLAESLAGHMDVAHVADAATAKDRLAEMLRPGDAVLVKGSNAIGLARVVQALAGEIA
ncbi:UDP-N-acetylmuramoyl-tripeptide--D-alanyl-D-alanine ligase [Sphingomonas oligoaromativorans]|uniref:UDP-N-acetylmuramoyl-tripeptide--D-alanyl-D- alanine ligase n=1 Tax=Sphingomonas oligoaromativorans TaxID=575322 RepID=UPI001423E426|nr:UDP-N-acetylmuramoyl-tripeptide--D-alanyl-D-alanine ligase [Sphingomonas oligoaromativorans]NIJ33845.1 UDP-N-acetylmuramoyl-tripeptide--D-alanyl-D-alanine ligase [Sphingomonas oligoaromativorans]